MINIGSLKQTGFGCPSQWDGKTSKGEYVYIRFRYGILTVDVSNEQVYKGYPYGEYEDMLGIIDQDEMVEFINRDAPNLIIEA